MCVGACVLAVPLPPLELVALVDETSPAVVAEEGTCWRVTPAALEKKGALPGCNRGTSCAPDEDACCGVTTGIENDSGRGEV